MLYGVKSLRTSRDSRLNDAIEGFGLQTDIEKLNDPLKLHGINHYQTVMFKPLCGIFQQTKYLPLRYCPLEIELELTDQYEPIIKPLASTQFTPTNTSELWKLQNCMVKMDLCTLDNALDNSYVNHLLSGKSLKYRL